MLLQELAALRVLAWRWCSLFVRLVYGHVLVEDVQRLFGGRELDGKDAFAVVDWLGGTLAELRAFAVGSAIFVEQRIVAVVGETETVVLSAVPAVVEAVAVAVDALYGVDAALGNGPLLAHLLLGVTRRLQSLHDAQADLVFGLLGSVQLGGRLRKVGQDQGHGGVGHGLVGVRGPTIMRGQAIVGGGLVARRCMCVLVPVLVMQRRRRWRRRRRGYLRTRRWSGACIRRGRDHESGADPEGQLGLGVLRLVRGVVEVVAQ